MRMSITAIAVAIAMLGSATAQAELRHALRDAQGRHYVPRGFVINTNDSGEQIMFSADDYWRMARMGANMQVVRLELGRFGTMPGTSYDPAYIDKLASLTRLGRDAGMKTVFKMTVYGVAGFSWEDFWADKGGVQAAYAKAWALVWDRFKDNPDVVGYDLVNEPRKLSMDISYDDLTEKHLIPYYERLIREARRYAPDKLFLCQTIFMNKGEGINFNQYAEMKKRINAPNIVFAPHIYQNRTEWLRPTMERFEREAALLDAPILLGEWGFPTFMTTDTSIEGQLNYRDLYVRTAELFDEMGVGSIKAWFLGNRSYQNFMAGGPSTWSIFQDNQPQGTVERKYITDVIVRPYPALIAGTINRFMFNHATRELSLDFVPDNSKGASRIFVGADRHYPDGFSLHVGKDMVLAHRPGSATGFTIVKAGPDSNPADFIWDESGQQVVVLRWPGSGAALDLRITPGIWRDLPAAIIPPRRDGD